MARIGGKGKCLDVFSGRAGRANAAIIDSLVKESPQTIKQLLKKITKYECLENTYYASLTKRLRNLTEIGLVEEIKPNRKGAPASYRLCVKAFLAMVLDENSMQDIFNQATNIEAAHILLVVLNVLLTKKDSNVESLLVPILFACGAQSHLVFLKGIPMASSRT